MSSEAKAAFGVEVSKEEAQINLIHAGFLLAEHLTRPFDKDLYLNLLQSMADNIRPSLEKAESDQARIQALNEYLFTDLKFIGNTANYYHPDNSFLNKVLDLRRGIPITLSVIYLELGWSLGLPVSGIGLPGHFIVGYGTPELITFIDVFNQGRLLSEEDCLVELAQLPLSDLMAFRRDYLKPVTKKAILLRMLRNLKQIYVALKDWEASYKTVDLMLQVEPALAAEIRDRGLIAYRLNRLKEAIFDVRHYLMLAPNERDAEWLEQHLQAMESKLARLN